ncbi:hypothetical protein MRBLMS1_002876 [Massilia sp. LMS1-1-1.1]
MDNTLLTRLAQYGKFTIEATALKLESVWYPQYRILGHKSEHKPALRGPLSTDSYLCGEVAIDIAVQRAMFDLEFGETLPA